MCDACLVFGHAKREMLPSSGKETNERKCCMRLTLLRLRSVRWRGTKGSGSGTCGRGGWCGTRGTRRGRSTIGSRAVDGCGCRTAANNCFLGQGICSTGTCTRRAHCYCRLLSGHYTTQRQQQQPQRHKTGNKQTKQTKQNRKAIVCYCNEAVC